MAKINLAYVDKDNRPLQNIRIKHTVIIDDGDFEDDRKLDGADVGSDMEKLIPSRSPSPIRNNMDGDSVGNVEDDVDIDEMVQNMTEEQIKEKTKEHQTK